MDLDKDDDTGSNLKQDIAKLTKAVLVLAAAHRRKRITDTILAIYGALLGVFVLLYYFVELPSRRDDLNTKISDLACYAVRLRPPGYSPSSDGLRQRYSCPPYDPSTAPSNNPTVAPTMIPGPTVTRRVPGPTVTRTPAAANPAPARTATATRTQTVYVAPVVTRTRTVTRPGPTTTVTATPQCVLLKLVCR